MFYRVANLPIEKVCIIKNFEEANFCDFKRLVLSLKINPKKYNWPQRTCKHLNNTFAGSNWSVIVMRLNRAKFIIRYGSLNFACFRPDVGP